VTCRRDGDMMIPFGMHKPVKLKKLMIDAGIERAMRRSVPVLRGSRGIVWAAGLRPGEICRTEEEDIPMIVEFRERRRPLGSAKTTQDENKIGGQNHE